MVFSTHIFWGLSMPNIWLPVAFVLLLGVVAWTLRADAEQAERRALAAEQEVSRLRSTNLDMADALAKQNAAFKDMVEATEAAEELAEVTLAPLPELIKKDRAVGTQPQEMNQWVDGLFSQP